MTNVRDKKHNHGEGVQASFVSDVKSVIFEDLLHEHDYRME